MYAALSFLEQGRNKYVLDRLDSMKTKPLNQHNGRCCLIIPLTSAAWSFLWFMMRILWRGRKVLPLHRGSWVIVLSMPSGALGWKNCSGGKLIPSEQSTQKVVYGCSQAFGELICVQHLLPWSVAGSSCSLALFVSPSYISICLHMHSLLSHPTFWKSYLTSGRGEKITAVLTFLPRIYQWSKRNNERRTKQ